MSDIAGAPTKRLVTPGMHRLLGRIATDPDADGELVREEGAGWWVGLERAHAGTCVRLLRLCLISRVHCSGDPDSRRGFFEAFALNEEGRAALKDPFYQPLITRTPAFKESIRRQPRHNFPRQT